MRGMLYNEAVYRQALSVCLAGKERFMNQELTALRRQNRRLTVLLVITLLVALVAAVTSVFALMMLVEFGEQLSAYAQELDGTLSQLDDIMDGLTTLSELVSKISSFFG